MNSSFPYRWSFSYLKFNKICHLHNILNQSYNATRKWLDFCMNMWCRIICLRHIAQLLTRNLPYSVSDVSTARFAELKSDWTKRLFGSQALSKRLKKKIFNIPYSNVMHQSFAVPAPTGPGNSGAFNFSVSKALLNALHCRDKFMVKSLLKAPAPGD